MNLTIAISNGEGNLEHNRRNQQVIPDHIDPQRSQDNRILADKDIRQAYIQLFDTARLAYNEKQLEKKRPKACIDDYYSHITNSRRNPRPFNEMVISLGNQSHQLTDIPAVYEIFQDFLKAFESEYPQLYVIGAFIHCDEKTPHLHLDYVPVKYGCQRGMSVQRSMDGALKQMYFSGWPDWHKDLYEQMDRILENYGITRDPLASDYTHIQSVSRFKQLAQGTQSLYKEYQESIKKDLFLQQEKLFDLQIARQEATKNLEELERQSKQLHHDLAVFISRCTQVMEKARKSFEEGQERSRKPLVDMSELLLALLDGKAAEIRKEELVPVLECLEEILLAQPPIQTLDLKDLNKAEGKGGTLSGKGQLFAALDLEKTDKELQEHNEERNTMIRQIFR